MGRAGADAGASPGSGPSSTPETRSTQSKSATIGSPESSGSGLAAHVQSLGWENREFSDVTVTVFHKTYPLHRLVLSRSSYFSALMRGPWADATSQTLSLQFDDAFMTIDAVETCLAFLYDKAPKFEVTTQRDNQYALRVLAAATYLDLSDLSKLCSDFVIASVNAKNACNIQNALDVREYGAHGEKIKSAVWGFITQHASCELAETIHLLNPHSLNKLLTSDELWVAGETERFTLARKVMAKQAAASSDALEKSRTDAENCVDDDVDTVLDRNLDASSQLIARLVLDDVVQAVAGGRVGQVDDSSENKASKKASALRRIQDFHVLACAATIAEGVRYQHVSFDDLKMMRGTLELEEKDVRAAAYRRMARGENDATTSDTLGENREQEQPSEIFSLEATRQLLDSTPARAAVEGWWTRTALVSRVTRTGDTTWQKGADLPFRFGVSFPDVQHLRDGQGAKHSQEMFYAGSFWKISVQAFSDEDPKGRRTLGLFLHRRPAVVDDNGHWGGFSGGRERPQSRDERRINASANRSADALDHLTNANRRDGNAHPTSTGDRSNRQSRQRSRTTPEPQPISTASHTSSIPLGVSHFVDHREVVDVRYELICPSKHEIVRLGSLDDSAKPTTLPRAPKGWGWRTALLHEDIELMCDAGGALRVVAAIVVDAATEGMDVEREEEEEDRIDADQIRHDDTEGFDGDVEENGREHLVLRY